MTSKLTPEIVKRLRAYHADMMEADNGECGATALYREAADEIERLAALAVAPPRQPDELHTQMRGLLRGFLYCPEIADCAPEDKDPETDALERDTRRLLEAVAPPPVRQFTHAQISVLLNGVKFDDGVSDDESYRVMQELNAALSPPVRSGGEDGSHTRPDRTDCEDVTTKE